MLGTGMQSARSEETGNKKICLSRIQMKLIPHLSNLQFYKWPTGHEKIFPTVISMMKSGKVDRQGRSSMIIQTIKWARNTFFTDQQTQRLKNAKDYVDAAWAFYLEKSCIILKEDYQELIKD